MTKLGRALTKGLKEANEWHDMIERVAQKVKKHMGWNSERTQRWFKARNPLMGGFSPIEFAAQRPEKFEKIVDSLIEGGGP